MGGRASAKRQSAPATSATMSARRWRVGRSVARRRPRNRPPPHNNRPRSRPARHPPDCSNACTGRVSPFNRLHTVACPSLSSVKALQGSEETAADCRTPSGRALPHARRERAERGRESGFSGLQEERKPRIGEDVSRARQPTACWGRFDLNPFPSELKRFIRCRERDTGEVRA